MTLYGWKKITEILCVLNELNLNRYYRAITGKMSHAIDLVTKNQKVRSRIANTGVESQCKRVISRKGNSCGAH